MADETVTQTNNQEQGQQQEGQAQTNQNGAQNANQQQDETQTFDAWYAALSTDVKDLLDDHTSGLKSALDDERRQRKSLATTVKELSKSAEAGSDLQKQLETLTGQMGEADTKATFYEGAHEAGVKNLRLAWIAAKEYDLVDRHGKVDFTQLKTAAPELFASKLPPPANAGSGANQSGARVHDMNAAIRQMAGRG